jgi:hypothetical protein
MSQGKYDDLIALLDEEASIIDTDDEQEVKLIAINLENVIKKLKRDDLSFSSRQQDAVAYAFEDVGELYACTGTCGGFDVPNDAEMAKSRLFHRRAVEQAKEAGLL